MVTGHFTYYSYMVTDHFPLAGVLVCNSTEVLQAPLKIGKMSKTCLAFN